MGRQSPIPSGAIIIGDPGAIIVGIIGESGEIIESGETAQRQQDDDHAT